MRPHAEPSLAEAKGFVRPCLAAVSVVKQNATLFRLPEAVDVQRTLSGKATNKKGMTVFVKPFFGCATFDGCAELAEVKGCVRRAFRR